MCLILAKIVALIRFWTAATTGSMSYCVRRRADR